MRGPIDYILVGFDGNNFDGSILGALTEALDSGVIDLVELAVIAKDSEGKVSALNITELGDSVIIDFVEKYQPEIKDVDGDDLDEIAELLDNDSAAGFLVVEQLWAKPLKQAILNANGYLLAEGRIHPEAAENLTSKGE